MSKRPILNVNFPLCLAPMVGLSHAALRDTVRAYMPEGAQTIWPTEMLNSRRLPSQRVGETPETARHEIETGLVPQILGNEEAFIAPSVKKLIYWGAEAIDINMGCPVKKALQHNYGVALMGDAVYAREVVRMTVRNSSVPVSVKLRSGQEEDLDYLYRFVLGLQDAGASWITLHPRLAGQIRRGSAKWQTIRLVREKLEIPVIGNGDVQTCEDVFSMLDQTGCDMVMAGRALAARPWLMWQVGERLGWPPPPGREEAAPRTPEQEGKEAHRSLRHFVSAARKYFEVSQGMRKAKFYVRTISPWFTFGNHLFALVSRANQYDELEHAIEEFFRVPQNMTSRTELRT